MFRKINVALIGAGVLGVKRINNLPKYFNLIAYSDLKKSDFINSNVSYYSDWKKILKLKNLHAVIISTYHSIQEQIMNEFIKKKIHIFVEKPGGINEKRINKFINLIRTKKNVVVRAGYNHRLYPAISKANEMYNRGQIGSIMYIRAIYGHGGRKNYHKEWRFKKNLSGGGELIDKGSHLIDLSRMFLGELKVKSSSIKTYFWKTKLEDNCFMTLQNKKKQIAFLHASCTEWKNRFIFEIFGSKGKLEIQGLGGSYGNQKLIYYKMKKNMKPPKVHIYEFKSFKNILQIELNNFYKDIIYKTKKLPDLSDVFQNLKIINYIYKNDNC